MTDALLSACCESEYYDDVGDAVLALPRGGAWARDVVVPEAAVAPLGSGDDVDFASAAALAVNYGTADLALGRRADAKPGETVLVTAAAGGVGLAAVDLAVDAGGAAWRNRGMRTLPRAHTWLGVGANLPSELRVWHGDASYDCGPALARVVEALADDPPDALGAGSHVVHVVVDGAPPLDEPEAGDTLTVALADALYDPADVAEVEKAGMLEVLVLETGAGGESEYLPAAYKPLYGR